MYLFQIFAKCTRLACLQALRVFYLIIIYDLDEQWLARRNGHVCGWWSSRWGRGSFYQISLLSNQPTVVTLPASLPTKYFFSSSAKSQFRRLALDLPFPERKVEEVSNVCGSPGHDVTGIEGGASWRSRQGLFTQIKPWQYGFWWMHGGKCVSRPHQGPGFLFPTRNPFIISTFNGRKGRMFFRSLSAEN